MSDLKCPFCSEDEFDAWGLKNHLQSGWCKEWNAIGPIPPEKMKSKSYDVLLAESKYKEPAGDTEAFGGSDF